MVNLSILIILPLMKISMKHDLMEFSWATIFAILQMVQGGCNPFLWIHERPCIFNTMAADGLATRVARPSAAMVLTQFDRYVPEYQSYLSHTHQSVCCGVCTGVYANAVRSSVVWGNDKSSWIFVRFPTLAPGQSLPQYQWSKTD